METGQRCMYLDEDIYGNWHAIGVLEDLKADGDVAQFLMALYSSQKQREGEESSIRCVHCHCPLTLYCNTCQCPSHLALPTHPPPPSLSSPPPPLPPQVLDTSAPVSGITDTDTTPVLGPEELACGVKEEGISGLPQDKGEFDFDDCPIDFGSVKPRSPLTASDDEPSASEAVFPASLMSDTSARRGKYPKNGPGEPAVTSNPEKRKTRTVSGTRSYTQKTRKRKGVKRKLSLTLTNSLVPDTYKYMDGIETLKEDNHVQTKGLIHMASQDVSFPGQVKDGDREKGQENLHKEPRKGKLCESQNSEDGFVLPAEERRSAQIHVFDESLFRHPQTEDKPFGCKKQKSANNTNLMKTVDDEDDRQNLQDSKTCSAVGDCSVPRKQSTDAESDSMEEAGRHVLRILISGQKIPPLKTADGSYTRSIYTHFECLYCKRAFIHKRVFNKHIQTHMDENLFKCSLCNRGFETLYSLEEHEKKHKYECDICGKKCTDRGDYSDHVKLHTENNGVMKCPGCAYQSTDFYMYRKHKYECAYLRPALQCEMCGVHLKSVKSLKHHIAAIHKNDRPYKCALCEKSFVFKTKLNCHMKYNHAEGGRLFHCDKCGNRFIDPKGLKSHQKSVHSNEKPFKCTYCPSAFARKYTLGVHLRLHTGEKPFRCTECLQAFVQKPSLLLHLRSHHGQESVRNKKLEETEKCP